MKQYILLLVLMVMGAGIHAYAEDVNPVKEGNVISGHVVEKGTENSLPYATILIVETGQGTVSNEDGEFRFKKVPAGKYTLRVQLLGYETQEKKVTVSNDFTVDVHFLMSDESIMTDEVVVSANRNETSRKVAPVVVNVMNAKLFESVNSTDLAKSLNYQSGLRVENNCQNCGFPQVRINGLEGPYSQILINSRPVVSALSGVYGLEQIPVNMIERVEVVRGGGSALFGANAVGGTINIITKDPINNSFQVSSTMSNMNGKVWEQYMGANASLVSKDNTYGIALYQSYRNRNPYDADGDGFSFALTCIGLVREILGAGEFFGIPIMGEKAPVIFGSHILQSYVPVTIFVLAPGAFFVLAALTAIQNKVKINGEKKGRDMSKIQSGCSYDCMSCKESGCSHRFYDTAAGEEKDVQAGKSEEGK